jgi:hypothetical protein
MSAKVAVGYSASVYALQFKMTMSKVGDQSSPSFTDAVTSHKA